MTPAEILAWVEEHHGARLNDDTRAVVLTLLSGDAREHVAARLDAIGVSYATARMRLQKKRLPLPQDWRRLRAGLAIAEAARGARRGSEVAVLLGYAEHSSVSHTARRAFGATLAKARRLDTPALLALWWERRPVHV